MSHRDELVRQAMALPAEDRAYVVTVLGRSLTSDGEIAPEDEEEPGESISGESISGEAMLAELERRSAAYRAGTTTARPAADVLADLCDRI